MAAPDLYATLGVEHTASRTEIRRAYRFAAKRAYPDGGGTRQEFDRVNRAHLVLCDDVRRAKYDRTGEIDDAAPDNEMAQIMQCLTSAMVTVVMSSIAANIDPDTIDMVAKIRARIRDQLIEIAKNKGNLELQRKFIVCSIKRVRVEQSEPNRLGAIMRGYVTSIDQALAVSARNQEIGRKALELLEMYSSPAEIRGPRAL